MSRTFNRTPAALEQAAQQREDAAFRQGFITGVGFAAGADDRLPIPFGHDAREAMELALKAHREIVSALTTEES